MAALKVCLTAKDLLPTVLDKMLDTLNHNAAKIARLTLSRFRVATEEHHVDEPNAVFLMFMIEGLSIIDSPIRHAFLDANSVQIFTVALSSISTQLQTSDISLVYLALSCLTYLRNCMRSGDGITAVCKSIQFGLLAAFVNCSPYFSDPRVRSRLGTTPIKWILEILEETLPQYLTYRSAVEAVANALQHPVDELKIFASIAKDAWLSFRDLAACRLDMTQLCPLQMPLCDYCQPTPAATPGIKLMKCAQCLSVSYCSKECQISDWKEGGHKSVCKIAKQERLEGKIIGLELRRRDRAFHYFISANDAKAESSRLRELAIRLFPGTPLSEFIIIMDYTVVPAMCMVTPLAEYDSRGISDSVSAEARNDVLLKRYQHNPDITLVESKILRGMSVLYVLTIVPCSLL